MDNGRTEQMVNRPGAECMCQFVWVYSLALHDSICCTLMVNAPFRMCVNNRRYMCILWKGFFNSHFAHTVGLTLIVLYPVCCLLSCRATGCLYAVHNFCMHTVCFSSYASRHSLCILYFSSCVVWRANKKQWFVASENANF